MVIERRETVTNQMVREKPGVQLHVMGQGVTLVFKLRSFARMQVGRDATRAQFGREELAARPLQKKRARVAPLGLSVVRPVSASG